VFWVFCAISARLSVEHQAKTQVFQVFRSVNKPAAGERVALSLPATLSDGQTIPKSMLAFLIGLGGKSRDFTVGADFACPTSKSSDAAGADSACPSFLRYGGKTIRGEIHL
jgi:hypothetical protein